MYTKPPYCLKCFSSALTFDEAAQWAKCGACGAESRFERKDSDRADPVIPAAELATAQAAHEKNLEQGVNWLAKMMAAEPAAVAAFMKFLREPEDERHLKILTLHTLNTVRLFAAIGSFDALEIIRRRRESNPVKTN